MTTTTSTMINGIDTTYLKDTMDAIKADHTKGMASFHATTIWKGGAQSETVIDSWKLADEHMPRDFRIMIDEPHELLGQNAYANPQEYLMAAMNACMLNTFVAVCSMHGVTLEHVEFRADGDLDLRGFLGLDTSVKPGYDEISYTIRVTGNGTEAQYRKAHEAMVATSPNYFTMANPIRMNGELVIL